MEVLIDGDNIQWDTFVDNVKDKIDKKFGTNYIPTIFCQTHVLIKFRSLQETNLRIVTARTNNKNATDARVLLEIGKLLQTSSKIIIVSNDRIFEEVVDNERIFLFGYSNNFKKTIIRKNVVLNSMAELSIENEDVYLSDLFEKINCKSISSLREYINKFVPEMYVAGNDIVSYV
tara:strand:+ start:5170 stop:5694 length:525 start_codon:yes stop_codon:yes gene_type:complete